MNQPGPGSLLGRSWHLKLAHRRYSEFIFMKVGSAAVLLPRDEYSLERAAKACIETFPAAIHSLESANYKKNLGNWASKLNSH